MRGVFDDEELEPVEQRRDTELTLGSGTLLVIFLSLVLLSGLCFGLGYEVGHRGAKSAAAAAPATATAPGEQEPLQASGSIPKPSAIAQDVVAPPAPASNLQVATPSNAAPAPAAAPQSTSQSTNVPAQAAPSQAQQAQTQQAQAQPSQVRSAFTPGASAPEPQQSSSAVRPAFSPTGTIMVQVAAVANPDDADVLMNALRKRSYPVTARRDQGDNLIHVRVGPFTTRAEAEQWKMRLLNDGYNAIVQP